MSYRVNIGFKKVKNGDDVLQVFEDYKQYVYKKLPLLFDAYYTGMACILERYEHDYPNVNKFDLLNKVLDLITKDFNQPFFYDKGANVVGIACSSEVNDFFDKCVFFQNSCDQDYVMGDWEGIPVFEKIFKDAMKLSKKELIERKAWIGDDDESCDLDYYRRSYAYEQIWARYENKVFEDSEAIYLSLFSTSYPCNELVNFAKTICNKYLKEKQEAKNEN